jgi:hypothetical protein
LHHGVLEKLPGKLSLTLSYRGDFGFTLGKENFRRAMDTPHNSLPLKVFHFETGANAEPKTPSLAGIRFGDAPHIKYLSHLCKRRLGKPDGYRTLTRAGAGCNRSKSAFQVS